MINGDPLWHVSATSGSGGDAFSRVFLSGALAAHLVSGAEPFVQFR